MAAECSFQDFAWLGAHPSALGHEIVSFARKNKPKQKKNTPKQTTTPPQTKPNHTKESNILTVKKLYNSFQEDLRPPWGYFWNSSKAIPFQ